MEYRFDGGALMRISWVFLAAFMMIGFAMAAVKEDEAPRVPEVSTWEIPSKLLDELIHRLWLDYENDKAQQEGWRP